MNRRNFLTVASRVGLAGLLGNSLIAKATEEITKTKIEPEGDMYFVARLICADKANINGDVSTRRNNKSIQVV